MIDSQTDHPAQQDGHSGTWTYGRQRLLVLWSQVQSKVRALTQIQWAQILGSVALLVNELMRYLKSERLPARAATRAREFLGDGPVHRRFALHLVVILLAAGVVAVGQVTFPRIDLRFPTPTPAPFLGSHTVTSSPTNRGGGRLAGDAGGLLQSPVPHTIIPERDRMEVITYTVQPNDNVWAIAQGFGLQVETLVWANPAVERAPDLLSVGQVLTVLPVDGVYHVVQAGDTVETLAKKFQTSADKIIAFGLNGLQEPYALAAGQKVVIPGGRKKIVAPVTNYHPMSKVGQAPVGAAKGSGRFAWPTQGYLSQRFWGGHPAIDVAGRTGTAVLAADGGYVLMAGRDTWGYGNQVLIDHGTGSLTRYAHLQKILVTAGDSVKKNQKIGTMGCTGRCTGPHLHFEVIQAGVRKNPLSFLP